MSALVELALSLPEATRDPPAGPWFVLEGKHWLRDRRLNERFLPLVYGGGVALVMESVHDARLVAALLNWCGVAVPPHPVTYY